MADGDWDMVSMGGTIVETHGINFCSGEHCSIHRPSEHHMRDWPQAWSSARRMVNRVCDHGYAHPDPDDMEFKRTTWGDKVLAAWGHHDCDGCCNPPSN
jgi:hypothetical protein